ncbi:MAG: hypothetical protein JSS60_06145 [Verrucomicrobia bacterium]|nr:hypothetical protein [Verrucomicrobiota bacterium]
MTSKFFLSLTAFSLAFSFSLSADNTALDEEFVEMVLEDEIANVESPEQQMEVAEIQEEPVHKSRRVAFPSKNTAQAASSEQDAAKEPPKKLKAHFAGVRKPPEVKTTSADTEKKPSRKKKNQWFSSKTQPKVEKKEAVKSEPAELPDDRPYFKRTNNPISAQLTAQNDRPGKTTMQAQNLASDESARDVYPRTGFQAPAGHAYLTAEWLFWRTRQEGMEFATSRQIEFDFESGFRVGLGIHLPSFDGWEIYANYTRFNPEHSHGAHGSFYPLFLFQGAGARGPAVAEARGHWEIEFQSVDVEFGKAYYLTRTLVFNPFFGFKGAWIEQHANFHYEGGYIPAGQTFRTHFKNDFKGAGPLAGTEINWQLGAGFSLFGDIAAALVLGQFDNEQQQHQMNQQEVVHLDTDFNLVSPMLQMVAGIAWDRNFSRDKCHLGFSAGFETQYWWSQNQTEQFTDDTLPVYVRQRGDLAFYGLTLRGRFDF